MIDESKINAALLGTFIIEAKRTSWASGKKAKRLKDGSKQYIYDNGIFRYVDNYFGDNAAFIGHEIVWRYNNPKLHSAGRKIIWGMNYYGWLTEKESIKRKDQVNKFLRKALNSLDDILLPFRGPKEYPDIWNINIPNIKNELIYNNETEGDIFNFSGQEDVALGTTHLIKELNEKSLDRGATLFMLKYHGGII